MDLGAFAYVTKPFNLDEIEEVVERASCTKNLRTEKHLFGFAAL